VKRLLLDLNVFLDVILDRPPDADVAAALWAAIERGKGDGMVPAHGVTAIFYLLEKARDAGWNVSLASSPSLRSMTTSSDGHSHWRGLTSKMPSARRRPKPVVAMPS
jgi:predicted nucleic acid-binding protein